MSRIEQVPRKGFFEKEQGDGFAFNQPLQDQLKNWKLETLCMCGVNASMCVYQTAKSAYDKGKYNIITSRDLISDSRGAGGMKAARMWFSQNGTYYRKYRDLLKALD